MADVRKTTIEGMVGPVHTAKLVEIWNRQAAEGTASFDSVRRSFSAYLQAFEAELDAQGVDVKYAAYMGAYVACKAAGAPIPAHFEQIFAQAMRGVPADDMVVDVPGLPEQPGADDAQSFAEGIVKRMLEDDPSRN